jgi:hypothetical protein
MPVNMMMCPLFLRRITGRAALMMFTFAKKLVSKVSCTRLIVRLLCASSSTAPITAVIHIRSLKNTILHNRELTFAGITEKHIDTAKSFNCFRYCSLALTDHPATP